MWMDVCFPPNIVTTARTFPKLSSLLATFVGFPCKFPIATRACRCRCRCGYRLYDVVTCSFPVSSYQGDSEEVGCYMAGHPLSKGSCYFEVSLFSVCLIAANSLLERSRLSRGGRLIITVMAYRHPDVCSGLQFYPLESCHTEFSRLYIKVWPPAVKR